MTKSSKSRGLLFILVGPSGVGKNSIMNEVFSGSNRLAQLPTATTRSIRENEQEGREHLFVSRDRFQEMIQSSALIEWQVVHEEWYGVPRAVIEQAIAEGQDMIADIEVLGALHLRSVYPDNVVLVFIAPEKTDDLRKRLETRDESTHEIDKRMKRVELEMLYAPLCDYLIVNKNDSIDEAVHRLRSIVEAERSRRDVIALRAERGVPDKGMSFQISVIPVYRHNALVSAIPPRLPTGKLQTGEVPYEGAMRLLRREFAFKPSLENLAHGTILMSDEVLETGSAAAHISNEHAIPVNFVYIYNLTDRIPSPENWRWSRYEDVGFPDAIHDALGLVAQS